MTPLSRLGTHAVEVVDGGGDLAEELPRLVLVQTLAFVDVIVELAASSVLDDEHDPFLVLKHCNQHHNNNVSHVVITSQ